ncbi:MAG: diacylglycerol kinase [Actinobacteria bacterium]|nr:diacylglycerol kinase [Actinomycetota bacterium]
MTPRHRQASLLQSFNHAFQGLVHSVRHQRNMRIHLAVAFVVLMAGVFLNLSRLELVVVIVTICLVLIAELLNTAIEAVVDIITDEFDPRAKIAKDVAAGAVLVAAINALVVAYLVFADKLSESSLDLISTVRRSPTHLTFVALAVVIIAVISLKATRGHVTLSGGLPSGHTALAFAGWTAVTFVTASMRAGLLVSAVSFVTAVLVAQSRVETGIHSVLEVLLGAILGIVVTLLIFQLWY